MIIIYNLVVRGYSFLIRVFSLFNPKARLWVSGRKNIFHTISKTLNSDEQRVWFHFASLGEFEQGRSVLEKFHELNPDKKIVMTFFSPSGYEIRKNYSFADYIFYLPIDTKSNARRFVDIIDPSQVFFTKYEYWYYYFDELHKKNIPLYIISAIFRKDQLFFKGYGGFYRNILRKVTHFFVQDDVSAKLLDSIQIKNHTITGDTRFDRVLQNHSNAKKISVAEIFASGHKCIVAGSTWPEDETLLCAYINKYPGRFKWIIVPHEISEGKLSDLENKLKVRSIRFSRAQEINSDHQVLIIDNVGMLSSLYQYALMAYIGGGFGKGIHNILEAAAFGIPVIFGTNYQKFKEARDLIELRSASSISNYNELETIINDLTDNSSEYQTRCRIAEEYVKSNAGATGKILTAIS